MRRFPSVVNPGCRARLPRAIREVFITIGHSEVQVVTLLIGFALSTRLGILSRPMTIVMRPLLVLLVFPMIAPRADEVDGFIKGEMDRHSIPGLNLEVIRKGEPIKVASYGL